MAAEGGRHDKRGRRIKKLNKAQRAYDHRIALALSSVEWIGEFAVFSAEQNNWPADGQLATAWIRAIRTTEEFRAALSRLGRVREGDKGCILLLQSPTISNSYILHYWCCRVTSALHTLLKDEAGFVSHMVFVGVSR